MKTRHYTRSKTAFMLFVVALLMMNGFGQSTLSVNVGGATAVVNKEIFGVLMERLGKNYAGGLFVGTGSSVPNTNGMRNDIIEGFKECGCGAIQFPGGCAAQGYSWNNNKNPSNDVGTDRFMQLCSLTTCTPIITGKSNGADAASNKAWVRYINDNPSHPTWTLKYFQIGNEVWGCGGNFKGWSAYKPNYNPNYDSLKVTVNNKPISTIAGTDLIGNNQWLKDMLADNASRIDNIEIHDYIYFPDAINSLTFTDAQYYDILNRANESQMRPRLDELVSILNQYDPNNRIKIWEGEWGDWLIDDGSDGWRQYATLMDGLSAGETLNLFIRYCNRMMGAGLAQGINVIHSLFNTNNNTLTKTPTFYVFKMYIPHHTNNAKYAPITITSEKVNNINAISAAATVNNSGAVHISLTNIDLTANRTVTITLTGTTDDPPINWAQIVTGPAKNSYNNYGQTEVVNLQTLSSSNYNKTGARTYRVTMPPRSIVMLSLGGTAIQSGTISKSSRENAFSIRSESNGRVLIKSLASWKTPVTISLYSADGRTLMNKVSKTLRAGENALFVGKTIGKGIYVITIVGENANHTKRVVVTR
jgi:alpha-N-arabinofuranosidase